MGRIYSALLDEVAVTGAQSFFRISAPSDAIVVLHEVRISNDDVETSQQLPLQIARVSTDGTGTSYVAVPLEVGTVAFGGTVVTDLSAEPTVTDILWRDSQNILNGWHYLPTPELRIILSPSGRIAIRIDANPTGSTKFSGFALFEEIGG